MLIKVDPLYFLGFQIIALIIRSAQKNILSVVCMMFNINLKSCLYNEFIRQLYLQNFLSSFSNIGLYQQIWMILSVICVFIIQSVEKQLCYTIVKSCIFECSSCPNKCVYNKKCVEKHTLCGLYDILNSFEKLLAQ